MWVPSAENRDLRQLLWHRHRLVQMRTRIMNQLQAVAMNEGVRRKQALWNKSGRSLLESLSLAPWATRRRQDLLELHVAFHSMRFQPAFFQVRCAASLLTPAQQPICGNSSAVQGKQGVTPIQDRL